MEFFSVIPWSHYPLLLALGLVAGILGGMLGVGGSIIMIPGLVWLFGQTQEFNQHTYQAAAMLANVAVAFTATLRHRRANTLVPSVLRWMMPAAILAVLVGVWLSNWFKGQQGAIYLAWVMAAFLAYVGIYNLFQVRHATASHSPTQPQADGSTHPAASIGVGSGMGLTAGLLGVGGGIFAVPMQQILLKLPLKSAIANSAAVMVVSAAVGAVYKIGSLGQHHVPWAHALLLAILLAPTCLLGGHLGASLTHRLPIRLVRAVFALLMFLAAWRLIHSH